MEVPPKNDTPIYELHPQVKRNKEAGTVKSSQPGRLGDWTNPQWEPTTGCKSYVCWTSGEPKQGDSCGTVEVAVFFRQNRVRKTCQKDVFAGPGFTPGA